MAPRAKKASKKKQSDCLHNEKKTEDEKENISLDKLMKNKKNDRCSSKLHPAETKTEEKKPLTSPPKEKEKLRMVGFWSKKLKDLELQEADAEKEKCSLYEFDGTEESESYKKKKKKKKKKIGVGKRKKAAEPKHNKQAILLPKHEKRSNKIPESERKIQKVHRKSLFREQIMLNKEREKLADRGKKFTFFTGMPSLGITSTPALNKDNLIGASNFLFLSPIIKEEAEYCSSVNGNTPLKSRAPVSPNIVCSDKENPKIETELKRLSCRRVLRSGKMLNT